MAEENPKMEAIIKIRPLSIRYDSNSDLSDPNDDNQHVLLEYNGVSDFDILQALKSLTDILIEKVRADMRQELIDSGIPNPTWEQITEQAIKAVDDRESLQNLFDGE